MTNQNFCQSCGMPMESPAQYGTEADGSRSHDYCSYCYDKGAFTFGGSMDEMIEICVPPMTEGNPDMTADKARQMMQQFFPTLKRWRAN